MHHSNADLSHTEASVPLAHRTYNFYCFNVHTTLGDCIMTKSKKKTCFVIGPIGSKDSPERAWSDDVFFNLVKPVASNNGFEAFRTIDDSRPGDITDQVIKALYDSDLVVADLSGNNPNAMYELAIRHSTGLPFIHISSDTSSIPFDVSVLSTVIIESQGFGGTQKTTAELDKHFKAILSGKAIFDNPVSKYLTLKRVLESGSSEEKEIAALQAGFENLSRQISTINEALSPRRTYYYSNSSGPVAPVRPGTSYVTVQKKRPTQSALAGFTAGSTDLVDRAESVDTDNNIDEN